MKTATVADLRNDFHRLSAIIEDGESIEITKRGHLFARLVPIKRKSREKLVKIDFMAQLKEMWGDRVFTDAEVRAMREAELGDRA
jgi:antitoxin (DNA-binding transcriptional repressor) of toxin-antitoxin stability system